MFPGSGQGSCHSPLRGEDSGLWGLFHLAEGFGVTGSRTVLRPCLTPGLAFPPAQQGCNQICMVAGRRAKTLFPEDRCQSLTPVSTFDPVHPGKHIWGHIPPAFSRSWDGEAIAFLLRVVSFCKEEAPRRPGDTPLVLPSLHCRPVQRISTGQQAGNKTQCRGTPCLLQKLYPSSFWGKSDLLVPIQIL